MAQILLVDDDAPIRDIVRYALEREGHKILEAANGLEGLECFRRFQPDLLVLDIMMPEMDGTDLCREIRKSSLVPILFLSSRDEELDRILGLELGGDDYVSKPFSPRELVARVKALLRRSQPMVGPSKPVLNKIEIGQLSLDTERFQVFWQGAEVVLTVTEFGLLRTLAERPGVVFTRDQLMDHVYDDRRYVSDRTMDSHIRRLRAKLAIFGASPIETIHGLGYKFKVVQ